MTKRISFRAWDGEKMLQGIYGRSLKAIACDDQLSGSDVYIPTGWDIMQFTGIVDKHGIDIYEKDILMQEEKAGYVYWNSVGGYYQLIELGNSNGCPDFYIFDGRTPRLGVIGNLYENKSLYRL